MKHSPKRQPSPTTILGPDSTVFRWFDLKYFTVDTHRHILRRDQANKALMVRDANSDQNRWTGRSIDPIVRNSGGLYCSMQQQAVFNEAMHYAQSAWAARPDTSGTALPLSASLNQKCVIKIRLLGPCLAAEISPHNPGQQAFLNRIWQAPAVRRELPTAKNWISAQDAISDGQDCSVARGIGLALASYGYKALVVQTVRTSERSPFELGDNVIFFGKQEETIGNLSVVEAYLFPLVGKPVVYPVEF